MKDCFECGDPATEEHHVVPQVRGGTETVPLCNACHRKVHSSNYSELTKEGLEKDASEKGNPNPTGRPPALTEEEIPEVQMFMKHEGTTVKEICEMFDVSRSALYRHVGPDGERRKEEKNNLEKEELVEPHSDLSREEAIEIRERYGQGGVSQQKLADEYGVSFAVISNLLRGKTWSFLGDRVERPDKSPYQKSGPENPDFVES